MPPRSRGGGRFSTAGSGGASGQSIRLAFKIEGLDKTDAEFKRIRREINGRIRDVMVRVGEREALPEVKRRFPRLSTATSRGLPPGKMAGSLKIKRERSGVFIQSGLRKAEDRALGWIDFGGQRPNDSVTRVGPKVIVTTLDRLRPRIDAQVLDAVMDEFKDFR